MKARWIVLLTLAGVALCWGGVAVAVNAAQEGSPPPVVVAPEVTPETESPEPAPETESPDAEPEAEAPESDLTTSQEQAIVSAQSYLENVGGFSRKRLIDQLEFDNFSTEDAEFAVDYLDVDWKEQAVISAESYMENLGGFSRQSLIDQLEFDGFTSEEAEYGVSEVYDN